MNDAVGRDLMDAVAEDLSDIEVSFGIEYQAARRGELRRRGGLALAVGLSSSTGKQGDGSVQTNSIDRSECRVRNV